MTKSSPSRIVVADDDAGVREALAAALVAQGHECIEADSAPRALEQIRLNAPDLVLLDLRMPGTPTIDLLPEIVKFDPALPIVIITGFGSIELAVSAMRAGAYDFLEKPVRREVLLALVNRAGEFRKLTKEVHWRRARDLERDNASISGGSGVMIQLKQQIAKVAAAPRATTLILGESGVGKELVARAIHAASSTVSDPWVAVNCAALSGTLLEAELFGYERGAFSGADPNGREGLFEQADGGTLFLDEVGEMELSLQSKLLRVLEERTVRRVGGSRDRKVNLRIIAASNRDLPSEAADGRFRADLYYRFAVVTLVVPPLRERLSDVRLLANQFLKHSGEMLGKRELYFSEASLLWMERHRWPGNVRELRNAVERACIVAKSARIEPDDLSLNSARIQFSPSAAARTVAEAEKDLIESALNEAQGNISRAAKALGLHRSTLHRKLDQYRLRTAATAEL